MATLADLAGRYQLNSRLLNMLTEDFSEDDWRLRPDHLNAAHWVLAHMAGGRRSAMRLMGLGAERDEWEAATGLGGDPKGFKGAPSVQDLLAEFAESGTRISGVLDSLSPESLARPVSVDLPDGSKTVGEAVFGLYMHECFHLGQLTMMRRLLGKPRFL